MLDSDFALLYQVETKRLNEAVKRNIARFPERFRFQLTKEEYANLKSQFATSSLEREKEYGGRRKLPYVFTEQGIAMLSSVLRRNTAIQVNIRIMDTFVEMRKYMAHTSLILEKVNHDRFLILDENKAYHIGASLKDAGKKCFGITQIEDKGVIKDILTRTELTSCKSMKLER